MTSPLHSPMMAPKVLLAATILATFLCSLSLADEHPLLSHTDFNNATTTGAEVAQKLVEGPEGETFAKRLDAVDCGRILIAEGDSWLDYPLHADIASALEKSYWAVYSSAHYGDTLSSMLYNGSQLRSVLTTFFDILSLNQMFEKLRVYENIYLDQNTFATDPARNGIDSRVRSNLETITRVEERCFTLYDGLGDRRPHSINRRPKAIILSAGGNDLIVDALNVMLEYEASSATHVIDPVISGGFFHRIQRMLAEYVSAIDTLCGKVFPDPGDSRAPCRSIPIFVHGYDYALVSGRGFEYAGVEWTGPWLKPRFSEKGHRKATVNNEQVKLLIDSYNDSLCHIATLYNQTPLSMPLYVLDFRGEVGKQWSDEIHPNERAFQKIARKVGRIVSDFHGLDDESFSRKYLPFGLPCVRTKRLIN